MSLENSFKEVLSHTLLPLLLPSFATPIHFFLCYSHTLLPLLLPYTSSFATLFLCYSHTLLPLLLPYTSSFATPIHFFLCYPHTLLPLLLPYTYSFATPLKSVTGRLNTGDCRIFAPCKAKSSNQALLTDYCVRGHKIIINHLICQN